MGSEDYLGDESLLLQIFIKVSTFLILALKI